MSASTAGLDAAATTFITHGRKSRARRDRRAAARRRRDAELRRVPRAVHASRSSTPATFEPGQVVRGVIGLDGGSTSSKAVLVDETRASILNKAYTLSKGNPIQDTKDLLARDARRRDRSGRHARGARASAPPATPPTCSRSRCGADVNIVETVAHMMSAVRFVPDASTSSATSAARTSRSCSWQNGDVKNFRLSNQCSAGNGMLLQAMADQFGVPVHDVRRHRVQARAAPEVQLRLRRLPRRRPRELPEGGLLQGGAARGPRAGAAEERLAVRRADPALAELGRVFVLQGGTQQQPRRGQGAGRLHQGARARTPRSFVHPHCGEAGAIGAAIETLRVVQRRGGSTLHRPRSGHRPRRTQPTNDESDALSLLPERLHAHVHRHGDPRRHAPAATSRASPARRAPSRARTR